MLLEIAIDSLEDALAATAAGAERLELAAALPLDGLTPTLAAVDAVLHHCPLPLVVLVRPRSGRFSYSEREADLYVAEVAELAARNVEALAVGALDAAGDIDSDLCSRLAQAARGRPLVFHRAFDFARDPEQALVDLKTLGFERVLSAGACDTATLSIRAQGWRRIVASGLGLVVAGGIRASNLHEVVAFCGAEVDLHSSARQRGATALSHESQSAQHQSTTFDRGEVSAMRAHLTQLRLGN